MATTDSSPETAERGKELTGRVALVTGGTRGIGAAICHSLVDAGAVVGAGFSSNRGRADELRQAVEADGGKLTLHQGNVGDFDDCQRVVHEVIDEHGRLDILVNNAGVTVDRPVWKMSVDDWHKVLRVNLSGSFYMTKPALVHMLERGTGRIINISSVTGEMGNIGQANYAASKSGLFGLTKTLALEAAIALRAAGKLDTGPGLTVNCHHPGSDRDRHGRHDPPVHAEHAPGADPAAPDGAAGRDRTPGVLPRPGWLVLHHRADLGCQRRTRHVIGEAAVPIEEW